MKTDYENTLTRAELELEIIRKNGLARPNQDKIDLMIYNLLAASDYTLDDEDFRQAIAAYTRIVNGNPLTEITGDPDEWENVPDTENRLWNVRAPRRVYMDTSDGRVYCRECRVFKRPDGTVVRDALETMDVRELPFRVPGRPKTVILYGNESPEQGYMRNLEKGKIQG